MRWLSDVWSVLSEAASDWFEDNAMRMGAALAFYSVLSLAPLLLIAISLAGLFYDEAEARAQLLTQVGELVGKDGAEAIQGMLDSGTKAGGTIATVVGIVTLIFGASGVFGELQSAMDAVWDVKPKPTTILGLLRARFLSFAMVLGTGFLLVVSLLLSTAIASLHSSARGVMPEWEWLWHGLSLAVTFAVVTLLFALIYKLLPDAKVAWHDVWAGAILTSILFTIGKFAIGLYLGQSGLASGYGAAGSLVVLIVWIYYSAQILFFGAEITHVIASDSKKQVKPEPHAVASPDAK
ncbi:YihY/virulence factor BrkB family protein [Anatilimnocola sp. NA78]|uniref:YihY/virulence factor BrkB family protein n=1 Tax=Anatilimnocola sp. NA78 TaxID=3415683 RepID=UPI003CE44EDB